MKTDPNLACANERQRLLWALVHDVLAHPLMGLSAYSKAALRFHDYTSHKAWPRTTVQVATPELGKLLILEAILRNEGVAFKSTGAPTANGGYVHTLELL